MISCKEITEQTNEFLDGKLSIIARMKFYMHLFICIHCKRYVAQLKMTIATLDKMGSPPPQKKENIEHIVKHICKHNKSSK